MEGLLMSLVLLVLPFVVLALLMKLLPPWGEPEEHVAAAGVRS